MSRQPHVLEYATRRRIDCGDPVFRNESWSSWEMACPRRRLRKQFLPCLESKEFFGSE